MTDRELLEKAAKAARLRLWWHGGKPYFRAEMEAPHDSWNPLTDDGDAFRLAVKLGMFGDTGMTFQFMEAVTHESTRRAIVRAAAALCKEGQPA